jgi:predicted RNA-binding protein with PIN domain
VGTVIVDGNNVMGATPDGWWRDRPAAVRRLLGRLQSYQHATGERIVLVLDVPQADLPEGEHDGIAVRYATRKGRNAADDRIRELLEETHAAPIVVVTSDRELASDVWEQRVEVIGARTLLNRLDDAGC